MGGKRGSERKKGLRGVEAEREEEREKEASERWGKGEGEGDMKRAGMRGVTEGGREGKGRERGREEGEGEGVKLRWSGSENKFVCARIRILRVFVFVHVRAPAGGT